MPITHTIHPRRAAPAGPGGQVTATDLPDRRPHRNGDTCFLPVPRGRAVEPVWRSGGSHASASCHQVLNGGIAKSQPQLRRGVALHAPVSPALAALPTAVTTTVRPGVADAGPPARWHMIWPESTTDLKGERSLTAVAAAPDPRTALSPDQMALTAAIHRFRPWPPRRRYQRQRTGPGHAFAHVTRPESGRRRVRTTGPSLVRVATATPPPRLMHNRRRPRAAAASTSEQERAVRSATGSQMRSQPMRRRDSESYTA
jgi:hypothetical protein